MKLCAQPSKTPLRENPMKNIPKYALLTLINVFLALVFASAGFGASVEKVLYRFPNNGTQGAYPSSVPVFDRAGDFYATTPSGGPAAAGVVFQLVPPLKKGGAWTEKIIHSFKRSSTVLKVKTDPLKAHSPE